MPHGSWIDTGFILANWEVRPRHGTLLRRDLPPSEPVRIEPRVMAVLTCLARHIGEVVTRDELAPKSGAAAWSPTKPCRAAFRCCGTFLPMTRANRASFVPSPESVTRWYRRRAVGAGTADASLPQNSAASATEEFRREPKVLARVWSTRLWRRVRLRARWRSPAWSDRALCVTYFLRPVHSGADAPPPVTRLLVLPFDASEAGASAGRRRRTRR